MKAYFKKLGLVGVLFFTLKGAAWLIVPLLVARGCN